MKKYEVMAIFTNELKEAEVEKQIDTSIKKKIKSAGGNITFEDFWGARGFAYVIKKQKWGYYFVAQFEAEADKITELKSDWNLDNKILRFLISLVDPKAPAPKKYSELEATYKANDEKAKKEEIKEEKKEAPSRKKLSTVTEEKTETKASEKKETPAPKAVAKKEESKEKEAVAKKDDVDKKLDDIINDSSLDL